MKRFIASIIALALSMPAFAQQSTALPVKLTVQDFAGVNRQNEAVTTGVPFPRGAVKDIKLLGAAAGGRLIPAQFSEMVPWPDGSVRWALLDTQVSVPANGKADIQVGYGRASPAPAAQIRYEDGEDSVKVSTGPMAFIINKKNFNIFESLRVDGRELITSASKGIVIVKDGGGEALAGAPTSVTIENAGPMRLTVCLRGRFSGLHSNLLGYSIRITAYAGQKYLKVHTWLENDGGLSRRAPGREKWFVFDGMALDFALNMGGTIQAQSEGAQGSGKFKVAQYARPNYDWKSLNYKITSGEQELKSGDRTDGLVELAGGGARLAVAIRHFWENYEKAIELDSSNLRLWLWPTDGEWPRSTVSRGTDSRSEYSQYRKAGVYHLSGGTRKGYETILDFSGRGAKAAQATLSTPLMALAEPNYYAATEAVNGWFAPESFRTKDQTLDASLDNWKRITTQAVAPVTDRGSLNFARQGGADNRGFWYGWMDFGDLLWAEGYNSLHYDWTWMMMLNYLRTGEREFLDMGVTMARHRIEVDQIWAGEQSAYNHLQRYEKCYTSVHGGIKDGHYTPIPTHNWISGVILYYMVTGEPMAKECALNNYLGMKARLIDKQAANPNPGTQTREMGWTILNLCSLYDMTADRKYLDDGLSLFNGPIKMKWENGGPYLGATGGNCLQYYYSIQGLTELHHRTGNADILKLLKEGCDGDYEATRPAYAEWKVFFSNLYAYCGYVEKNAEYINKAKTAFNEYSQANPRLSAYSTNGAWAKASGKFIRNGHILQYVLWKNAGGK